MDEDFMVFHQGIIHRAEKNLPYAAIQNVIITQDIWDRILGMYTLLIENAASAGGVEMTVRQNSKRPLTLGFYSNSVMIPGLSAVDAQKLKESILYKMKTKSLNQV
jgi:membrane protein YdbS with pleckstrin-like domain